MSNWKLVRLKFGRHIAHFGEVGIGIEETSERVRSDTLFSAWMIAYARLFGGFAVEDLLGQFLSQISVRISSTLIYRRQDNKFIYYLPRPLKFPKHYPKDDDLSFFKAYKKLKYLPLDIWQRWYQGEGFTDRDRAELEASIQKRPRDGALYRAGAFDYSEAYHINQFPKVAVDRVTRATNFYRTGFVQFQWQLNNNELESLSGLYFLLNFTHANSALENRLYAALELLGEEGLGGERSSGAGRFEIDSWDQLTPNWQEVVDFKAQNHYSLISLFWQPSLSEKFLDGASYEIIERGGWIGSPFSGRQLRRKKVCMFAEGSVFASQPHGELVDVTPKGFSTHAIYRNGIGLSLPILT